jgi:hypothetical protein
MTFVRRVFIVLLVLVIPPVLATLVYRVTSYAITATNHAIDPMVLTLAWYAEIAAFAFVTILEARDRW